MTDCSSVLAITQRQNKWSECRLESKPLSGAVCLRVFHSGDDLPYHDSDPLRHTDATVCNNCYFVNSNQNQDAIY